MGHAYDKLRDLLMGLRLACDHTPIRASDLLVDAGWKDASGNVDKQILVVRKATRRALAARAKEAGDWTPSQGVNRGNL